MVTHKTCKQTICHRCFQSHDNRDIEHTAPPGRVSNVIKRLYREADGLRIVVYEGELSMHV